MSKSNSFKEKFKKFIAGNGFYAILAVCLVGAGAAAWVAVNNTIDSIDENNKIIEQKQSSKAEMPSWDFDKAEKTENKKDDIKIEGKDKKEKSEKTETAKPKKQTEEKPAEKKEKTEEKKENKTLRPQSITFIMPVEGNIITAFSNGKLVKDPTLDEWKTHNGVDIKVPVGSAVVSCADGKIEKIYKDKLWGCVIEVSHSDGTTAHYCGIEPINNIKEGDIVRSHQQIGKTIQIPCEIAVEPHLHFAMKQDGKWINPLKHMGMEK